MTDKTTQQYLPPGRQAGACLHITSLPGPYGIGEIGQQALRFVDTMKMMQLGVWQFLPTGPTAYGDSPYQSLSTFAGNELLIDIDDLISLQLVSKHEAQELATRPSGFVDYGALIPIKNRLLHLAAGRFEARASAALKSARDDFVDRHDKRWLHDYALFRILKTQHGEQSWLNWKPEFLHRDAEALRTLESTAAVEIADTKVIQFLFHYQWQRLRNYANEQGVRLFGDMPFYIALDSADAWANPEILRIDHVGRPNHVAGVPPDFFSEDGQLWGNPLYAWENHAANDYRWWIDRLRASADLADIVRIDHFRGFESYWSVPADSETARQGAVVRLFGDMPFYIALDSADAWANPEILRIDHVGRPNHVAGVPPDFFSEDGQLWGNPLYAWENHAANDYRWWIDRLRASADLADIVRIDHFRGFESYWSVPADSETARQGAWEPGPGDAIFDAIHQR